VPVLTSGLPNLILLYMSKRWSNNKWHVALRNFIRTWATKCQSTLSPVPVFFFF